MDIQFFGGRGGRSNKKQQNKTTTPSGVTYEQFKAMSDDEKYNFIQGVIDNPNITVPDYLDKSITSKVMYAMGMNNKPQVVSDAELDKIKGRNLYRTVYDASKISSIEILDQIRYSDYTQLSGDNSSSYGRAIYFARSFNESAMYGGVKPTAVMMRAKINPNANIISESKLLKIVGKSDFSQKTTDDGFALTALVKGYDGWRDRYSGYTMIINREALTVSSTTKKIGSQTSWHESEDVK